MLVLIPSPLQHLGKLATVLLGLLDDFLQVGPKSSICSSMAVNNVLQHINGRHAEMKFKKYAVIVYNDNMRPQ